jgi:Fic family protein
MISHTWRPIDDLPDDWEAFARPDLDEMLRLWNEERQHLADPGRAVALQDRLANLWAIETGVIERLYTIDRGTTESLVELGLGAIEQFSTTGRLTQSAARLIEDQRGALDFVFAYIKDDRPLTLSYIRELHQLLMQHQSHTDAINQFGEHFQAQVVRGAWKIHPNNPTTADGSLHEYAPPHLVQDEMDQLIRLHQQHLTRGVRPEVEAAWLHHRFTQIHPFQDGNGRVARALATMIFLKAGFVPLVIRDDDHRERYLDALEIADGGDLGPLVSLFANVVTADLNDAITFVRTMHGRDVKSIAAAAAEASLRRFTEEEAGVVGLTNHYAVLTHNRLTEVGHELEAAFRAQIDEPFLYRERVYAEAYDGGPYDRWREEPRLWRWQSVKAASSYGYIPDLTRYRREVGLQLPDGGMNVARWHVAVSFHHKEARSTAMAAVLFLTTVDESNVGDRMGESVVLGTDREFTFSGSQQQDDRFRAWLDAGLLKLLEEWQARI